MTPARQFSLSTLFLEILWIAAALGCFTQLPIVPENLRFVFFLYGVLFGSIAVGGLFGRMVVGFWVGLSLVLAATFGSLAIVALSIARE